jgi:hypothetical protein
MLHLEIRGSNPRPNGPSRIGYMVTERSLSVTPTPRQHRLLPVTPGYVVNSKCVVCRFIIYLMRRCLNIDNQNLDDMKYHKVFISSLPTKFLPLKLVFVYSVLIPLFSFFILDRVPIKLHVQMMC